MKRYIFSILLLTGVLNGFGQQRSADIGTYPPQIHQQICRESTFTRLLDVFNSGDATLTWTAAWSPAPVGWAVASPMSGQIEPGDTSQVQIDLSSFGLPLDNYLVDLVFSSNDPGEPQHTVLVMLHVQDLTILINPDLDTVCSGCPTKINTIVFGCSEAYSFLWVSNPPGFTSTEKSPIVNPEVTTKYTVTVTDGGYSKDGAVTIYVSGGVGIDENVVLPALSVYPNPASGDINVSINDISQYQGIGEVLICDVSGRVVFREGIFIREGKNEINLHDLNLDKGIYLLSIRDSRRGAIGISKVLVR